MSILLSIVMITAIAGVGGTGFGGFIGAVLKKDSTRVVSLLLSFAGGVMMAVVCFDLIPEATHPEGTSLDVPIWIVCAGVMAGYFIIYLLNLWIDKKTNPEIKHIDDDHPKTADDLDELIHADHYNKHQNEGGEKKNLNLFIAGIVMACAIALHNMPEGIVIGASYAADHSAITSGSGFIIAVVIGLHNIPEGMAVSVPLISGGMKKGKAIAITALSGAPTILGALVGYTLGLINPLSLSLSLSFAGGAMLYVVFGELFPEAFLMYRSKTPGAAALIGTLVGLILVYV